jgi:hypothetical protein
MLIEAGRVRAAYLLTPTLLISMKVGTTHLPFITHIHYYSQAVKLFNRPMGTY